MTKCDITQGLTLDTSALTLNGNSRYVNSPDNQTYEAYTSEQYHNLSQNLVPVLSHSPQHKPQTPTSLHQPQSPLQVLLQCFSFFAKKYINFYVLKTSMGLHRSTTPSDHSCSAPASPVSHNISPISSPGLVANNLSKSPFTDNSYFNVQQTNVLQQQLEQFRMIGDKSNDPTDHYLMVSQSPIESIN